MGYETSLEKYFLLSGRKVWTWHLIEDILNVASVLEKACPIIINFAVVLINYWLYVPKIKQSNCCKTETFPVYNRRNIKSICHFNRGLDSDIRHDLTYNNPVEMRYI